MRRDRWWPLVAVLLAALAALPLAACGRRGPPVAPERRVPAPVTDLSGVVRPGGIELTWTNPTRRADQTRLRDLSVARVFRAEDAGAGEARPAILERGGVRGYTEVTTVRLASPAPATLERERVTLTDRQALTVGRRYTYVVVTADTTDRLSPPSSRLTLTFVSAPEPPRSLVAQPGEGAARLAWSPPARLTDGSAPGALTYEVLSAGTADAPLAPLATPPVTTTELTDRGLENDRTYYYAVRAIRTDAGTKAVSDPTERVAVTPVDVTPPSPPRDLVAIPSERTVRLAWNVSPDPDVAAYVVYRARDGGGLVRIGSTRAPVTVFVDRDVPPGRYRYTVTAEDSSSRRNESGRSNDVTVSVP